MGWALRDTRPEALVREALNRALAVRRLVVHSDQRSPYAAARFRTPLAQNGAGQRRSRRGNFYDNALPDTTHAESVWSRLNTELLAGGTFPGLAEARLKISHYFA